MANLVSKIPVTIKVAEVPLTTAMFDRGSFSSIWNKWFSQIGTFITRSQENKSGDILNGQSTIGSYRATRVGNIIQINGSINAGTYSNIIVSGIPVNPLVPSPILITGGTGSIDTNGDMTLNCTSTSTILFSASYIANAPKEN